MYNEHSLCWLKGSWIRLTDLFLARKWIQLLDPLLAQPYTQRWIHHLYVEPIFKQGVYINLSLVVTLPPEVVDPVG